MILKLSLTLLLTKEYNGDTLLICRNVKNG
jgi:hypothetical protein